MKVCFKCQQAKPLSEFYPHPQMADGLLGKCKECARRDAREHRLRNIQAVLEYDRIRTQNPSRRAARILYQSAYRQRHPDKFRAHSAVSNAIRDGRLTKQSCEVCGGEAEAHHDDYSKPLEVKWLCFRHHRKNVHNQMQYLSE